MCDKNYSDPCQRLSNIYIERAPHIRFTDSLAAVPLTIPNGGAADKALVSSREAIGPESYLIGLCDWRQLER